MTTRVPFQSDKRDVVQYAVEAVEGVAVAATHRYFGMDITMKPNLPTTEVMQAGLKYAVDEVPGKGFAELDFKGEASVQDIISFFSTLLCTPVFTTVSGSANDATFAPNSFGGDELNTLTVEKGQRGAGNAYVMPGCFGIDGQLNFTPDKTVAFTGKMQGRAPQYGHTLTANVNSLASSVLTPKKVSVSIAPTEGGLTSGKQVAPYSPLSAIWKYTKAAEHVMSLDDTNDSFDGSVEDNPDFEYDLVFARNPVTTAYIQSIALNTLYYLQINAVGFSIDGTNFNQVILKSPVKFKNPGEGNNQGAYTNTLTARAVHRDDFNGGANGGGALVAVCRSALSSLT